MEERDAILAIAWRLEQSIQLHVALEAAAVEFPF